MNMYVYVHFIVAGNI